MNDDRTLLERAAKAAGHVSTGIWNSYRIRCEDPDGRRYWFAPLTDDADAFLLAVKLELDLRVRSAPVKVTVSAPGGHWIEETGEDKLTATRRAIVRAAASLAE